VNARLRPAYRSIWFVGGGALCGECLRLGLADEVRYSIVPVLMVMGSRSSESSRKTSRFTWQRSKRTGAAW
jgi:dihydrofolate reductase